MIDRIGLKERRIVRWGSVLLFAFLVFQTFVVLRFGEPWPSISLPKFSNPGGEVQVFEVTKPSLIVYFGESKAEKLNVNQFLNIVPRSHRMAIMSENYKPVPRSGGRGSRGESQAWEEHFKDWMRSVFQAPTVVAPARTPEGTDWTRQRLKALFPNRELLRCEVQWRRITYERDHDQLVETGSELVQTLQIDL